MVGDDTPKFKDMTAAQMAKAVVTREDLRRFRAAMEAHENNAPLGSDEHNWDRDWKRHERISNKFDSAMNKVCDKVLGYYLDAEDVDCRAPRTILELVGLEISPGRFKEISKEHRNWVSAFQECGPDDEPVSKPLSPAIIEGCAEIQELFEANLDSDTTLAEATRIMGSDPDLASFLAESGIEQPEDILFIKLMAVPGITSPQANTLFNHGFRSPEDLLTKSLEDVHIKGIGPKTMEAISGWITSERRRRAGQK